VPGEVEPVPAPSLAVVRAGQEPVDQPLVGVRRAVGEEGLDLFGRRRQAGHVERHPADQGPPIPLGGRGEPSTFQRRQQEPIDRVPGRALPIPANFGRLSFLDRPEAPEGGTPRDLSRRVERDESWLTRLARRASAWLEPNHALDTPRGALPY